MSTQTRNGKALEYAFLQSLTHQLNKGSNLYIEETSQFNTAKDAYFSFVENRRLDMDRASVIGIQSIIELEPRLQNGTGVLTLSIQQDATGQLGDVRDVLAIRHEDEWEIGISCKNNHTALKHSRISGTIDIGESWFGYASTPDYFNEITPIFDELETLKQEGMYWRDIPDKAQKYYMPVLEAVVSELKRLDDIHKSEIPKRLLSYLLGRHDFYKAIVDTRRKTTEIQGFNLYGTLNQNAKGKSPQLKMPQLKLPNRFYDIHFKEGSDNTIVIVCDEGWTISARIHNASSKVEKSLKLDVKLVGLPPSLYRHIQSWSKK